MRLKDKVAIITGAGSGIGRQSAIRFAEEGAKLILADLNKNGVRETIEQLVAGTEAEFVAVDVSKAAEVRAMVEHAETRFGRLDVMFNNAGIMPDADSSVIHTSEDVWDLVINVNLKGVFLGCQYGIPTMLKSGGGSIINVASFVALMGAATPQIAYTASKGGVLSMTREIAVEFARQGIRANALCPGPVRTPLLEELLSESKARARRMVHIPMGRLAEGQEIANAVVFLASDESSYVNGATFVVDGGITAAYVTPE